MIGKNMYKVLVSTLLFLALCLQLRAQDTSVIAARYKLFSNKYAQEKIYVHTDKTWYFTGELLWFKLYLITANTSPSRPLSTVGYVDILNSENNSVLQAKVALKGGLGSGSLYLPVTLTNGNYKLRAYTSWMKNLGPDAFFEKVITIVNPLTAAQPIAAVNEASYDVQFFAEGGTMVSDMPATVAFKAVDSNGSSAPVSGAVVNQRNDTIARFKSELFGMGHFNFTPVAGDIYKAIVRIAGQAPIIKPLPAAESNGSAVHLVTNGGQTILTVYSTTNAGLYLLSHSSAGVGIAQSIKPGLGNNASVTIDQSHLGDGVNTFTLFNANGQPVCERLFFKRPKLLNLKMATSPRYDRRSKVDVDISSGTNAGQSQSANLSLSVYRIDSLNNYTDDDIAAYFWLSADVKGRIEHPGYYFTHTDKAADGAMDNLLLTQGWRRFKWDDVFTDKLATPVYPLEDKGHIISAKVTHTQGGEVEQVLSYLSVVSGRTQLYAAHADKNGQLYFNTRDFYGPNEIVLQTHWLIDSTYRFTVNSPFSNQYSANKLQPFKTSKQLTNMLADGSVAMQMQNLYQPGKLRLFQPPVIDSNAFWTVKYKSFLLKNYTRYTTMDEVLREYVSKVNVLKKGGQYHIKMKGPDGYYLTEDPLVLLDGVPIFNPNRVFAIDPLSLNKIDVYGDRYYWGPTNSFGVIAFSSNKTDLGGFEIDKRSLIMDYEGLQVQREFYSPLYDTNEDKKSRIPDFRNLLYWKPNISTGADGKAKASFYTSDRAGRYVGVLQGIGANGQVGSTKVAFEVN